MQAPLVSELETAASYAGLPAEPAEALQWLAALPEATPFAALEAPLSARSQQHGSPYWLVAQGFLQWRLQRPAQALALYQEALPHATTDPTFHLLRGMAARKLPDQQALAQECYERALELDPLRSDAHYNLANLYREERPLDAERSYRASLSLQPDQPMAWHNYGILLLKELRLPEALQALQWSVQLDPQVAAVWCNLGLTHFAEKRLPEARRALARAIALDPAGFGDSADEALARWERGEPIEPGTVDAVWDLGLIALADGDYTTGWHYYEIRFSTKNFVASEVPTAGQRLRQLSDAPRAGDSPLVVWSEQGLGDAIQFGRYLPILEAAGIPYEFRCRESLLTLFRDWFGLEEKALPETHRTDPHDQRPHCSLLSLPWLFRSDLATIPSVTPYIKPPGPAPAHLTVPTPPGGLSVGLVWAANPKNKAMYRHKSIPVRLLMPRLHDLLELDLIDLHCLQFGADNAQLDPWRSHERITDWSARISDFADTAHVINQLDLVITVDTAVAHLAGALNRPTWLLLPSNCDFRWLLEGTASPWYPHCLRLFRQPAHGDWDAVVQQLHRAIDELFLLDFDALMAARITH